MTVVVGDNEIGEVEHVDDVDKSNNDGEPLPPSPTHVADVGRFESHEEEKKSSGDSAKDECKSSKEDDDANVEDGKDADDADDADDAKDKDDTNDVVTPMKNLRTGVVVTTSANDKTRSTVAPEPSSSAAPRRVMPHLERARAKLREGVARRTLTLTPKEKAFLEELCAASDNVGLLYNTARRLERTHPAEDEDEEQRSVAASSSSVHEAVELVRRTSSFATADSRSSVLTALSRRSGASRVHELLFRAHGDGVAPRAMLDRLSRSERAACSSRSERLNRPPVVRGNGSTLGMSASVRRMRRAQSSLSSSFRGTDVAGSVIDDDEEGNADQTPPPRRERVTPLSPIADHAESPIKSPNRRPNYYFPNKNDDDHNDDDNVNGDGKGETFDLLPSRSNLRPVPSPSAAAPTLSASDLALPTSFPSFNSSNKPPPVRMFDTSRILLRERTVSVLTEASSLGERDDASDFVGGTTPPEGVNHFLFPPSPKRLSSSSLPTTPPTSPSPPRKSTVKKKSGGDEHEIEVALPIIDDDSDERTSDERETANEITTATITATAAAANTTQFLSSPSSSLAPETGEGDSSEKNAATPSLVDEYHEDDDDDEVTANSILTSNEDEVTTNSLLLRNDKGVPLSSIPSSPPQSPRPSLLKVFRYPTTPQPPQPPRPKGARHRRVSSLGNSARGNGRSVVVQTRSVDPEIDDEVGFEVMPSPHRRRRRSSATYDSNGECSDSGLTEMLHASGMSVSDVVATCDGSVVRDSNASSSPSRRSAAAAQRLRSSTTSSSSFSRSSLWSTTTPSNAGQRANHDRNGGHNSTGNGRPSPNVVANASSLWMAPPIPNFSRLGSFEENGVDLVDVVGCHGSGSSLPNLSPGPRGRRSVSDNTSDPNNDTSFSSLTSSCAAPTVTISPPRSPMPLPPDIDDEMIFSRHRRSEFAPLHDRMTNGVPSVFDDDDDDELTRTGSVATAEERFVGAKDDDAEADDRSREENVRRNDIHVDPYEAMTPRASGTHVRRSNDRVESVTHVDRHRGFEEKEKEGVPYLDDHDLDRQHGNGSHVRHYGETVFEEEKEAHNGDNDEMTDFNSLHTNYAERDPYGDDADTIVSWETNADNPDFSAWAALKDEYAFGYGHQETLPFLILGTDADDDSCEPHVLSPPLMESLQSFLPERLSAKNFWLKFSCVRDGYSLRTLLRNVRGSQHTIIAIETTDGRVFGSFTSTPWRRNWGFFGNGECFVWRMRRSRTTPCRSVLAQARLESEIEVHVSSGRNDCYQACKTFMLAIGGGEGEPSPYDHDGAGAGPIPSAPAEPEMGFAFAVTDDLSRGTTCACATFDSPCLTDPGEDRCGFEILNVEAWAFTSFDTEEQAEKNELGKMFIDTDGKSDLDVIGVLLGV